MCPAQLPGSVHQQEDHWRALNNLDSITRFIQPGKSGKKVSFSASVWKVMESPGKRFFEGGKSWKIMVFNFAQSGFFLFIFNTFSSMSLCTQICCSLL